MGKDNSIHILADRPDTTETQAPSRMVAPADSRIRPVPAGADFSQPPPSRSDSVPSRKSSAFQPATAREPQQTPHPPEATTPKPRSRTKPVLAGLGALAFLGAAWFAYDYITLGRFIVSTDDAYVGVDIAIIAPQITAHRGALT